MPISPPLSNIRNERSLWSPQAALDLTPWKGGHLRAAYSRSLGGLYFDNSVRLEPSQLAGFTTAFRSLIPESVEGLVPGTKFEVVGAGFDQWFPTGTYFGIEADLLDSYGQRGKGVLTNSLPIKLADSPSTTLEDLKFRERSASVYANQLVLRDWSLGAAYRLTKANLNVHLLSVPPATRGSDSVTDDERALLHHLQLSAIFNHPTGFFAQWHTGYFHQSNFGSGLPSSDFWQHDLIGGYRFAHHRAEVRLGILNLTDHDYRLNPLNLQSELPRRRTFTASVRLNL